MVIKFKVIQLIVYYLQIEASVTLVYADATKGWLYTEEHNVGRFTTQYIYQVAQKSTSGDYKIHTI